MHDNLPGTPPLVRAVNRRLILDRVRQFGEASRAELAKLETAWLEQAGSS